MTTMECPWCSADVDFDPVDLESAEGTCSACSSSWLTEPPKADALPLAA